MASVPSQIAETVQTAHIKRDPSPAHDVNPSVAASGMTPATARSLPKRPSSIDNVSLDLDDDDDDEIPLSVLRPRPRKTSFPPMPDLRFEQSYLNSLRDADTWWKVAWITVRDQMMMPMAQGVLYNLALAGWGYWNRNAQYSGGSAGARLRRWWYEVNHWPIPGKAKKA